MTAKLEAIRGENRELQARNLRLGDPDTLDAVRDETRRQLEGLGYVD